MFRGHQAPGGWLVGWELSDPLQTSPPLGAAKARVPPRKKLRILDPWSLDPGSFQGPGVICRIGIPEVLRGSAGLESLIDLRLDAVISHARA